MVAIKHLSHDVSYCCSIFNRITQFWSDESENSTVVIPNCHPQKLFFCLWGSALQCTCAAKYGKLDHQSKQTERLSDSMCSSCTVIAYSIFCLVIYRSVLSKIVVCSFLSLWCDFCDVCIHIISLIFTVHSSCRSWRLRMQH